MEVRGNSHSQVFFKRGGVDQYIVYISDYIFIEYILENFIDEGLEYCWGIGKPIGHEKILKVSTVFHSSPFLMRIRLYALRKSNLIKTLAHRSCSRTTGTKGNG